MQDLTHQIFGNKDQLDVTQECARAALIFFYGLVMLRLSGRRTFASMSALDIIVSIVVGSMLSRTVTGASPFGGTLAAVATIVTLHVIASYAIARSDTLSRLVEGPSIRLATNGIVDDTVRVRHKISRSDMAEALRSHGLDGLSSLSEVRKLELEPSGKISVVR
jgi:uncharacterized membrane protein YcaP (DUF421 family)